MSELRERDALVLALRQRGGRATDGDLAADTGLHIPTVARHLRDLLAEYESHLAVDDAGNLIYLFEPTLTRRDPPDSPAARRARRRERLVRVWQAGVRAATAGVFVLYAALYAALGLVGLLVLSGGMGSQSHVRRLTVGLRNRFRQKRGRPLVRDLGAPPWAEGATAYPVVPPLLPALREGVAAVAAFATVPFETAAAHERDLIALVREREGVVTAADRVEGLGGSLDVAERDLTQLLVRHGGDIDVTDDGILVYRFDALVATAGQTPPAASKVWDRLPAGPWSARADRLVSAFLGVTAGGTVACGVGLHVLAAQDVATLAGVSLGVWWWPAVVLPGAYVVVVTAGFGARVIAGVRARRAAQRSRPRHALLRRVTEVAAPLRLDAGDASESASEDVLRALVSDLRGEVRLGADGRLEAVFTTYVGQLAAAALARTAAQAGRPRRIVYSTRTDDV